MAPEIDIGYRQNKDLDNRLRLLDVPGEVEEWLSTGQEGRIITIDELQIAPPAALPLLRSMARYPLLEGMRLVEPSGDQKTDEEKLDDLVGEIAPYELRSVGDISEELWDNGRTKNWVIPIRTDMGEIQIVVNQAWGVGWRLAPGYVGSEHLPQLHRVQNSDTSQPPEEDPISSSSGNKYLPPDVLAQATKQHIDAVQLAAEIRQLLVELSDSGKVEIEQVAVYSDGGRLTGEAVSCFSIINRSIMRLNLGIGCSSGSKFVQIIQDEIGIGFESIEDGYEPRDDIIRIGKAIDSFDKFPESK